MNSTTNKDKEFGVVSLLDALGTRQRLLDNIDNFINDWNAVLVRLDENTQILESKLNSKGYRTGIKTKDIFDNIQIFYPTDDPRTKFIDLTGSNPVWWSIQHTAELLTNLVRTQGAYFSGDV